MKKHPMQTVVFLPGWGFSASMWQPINVLINNSNQSYLTKFVDLSETQLTQPLPEGAILIGWSLGGLLAIQQCLLHPHRYQKLILVNSSAYFSKFTTSYKNLAESDLSHFKTLFLRWVFYPQHASKVTNWDKHVLAFTQENQSLLLDQLNFLFATDLRETYEKLILPILQVQGSRDAVVANESRHRKANEKTHLLSGGHALPFTHAMELADIIRDFLWH